jgi:hypothetical protein
VCAACGHPGGSTPSTRWQLRHVEGAGSWREGGGICANRKRLRSTLIHGPTQTARILPAEPGFEIAHRCAISGSLGLPVRLRTSLCPTKILPPGSRWRPDESTPAHSTQIAHTVRRNARRRAQACILTAGRCAERAAKSSACTGHATVSGCVWQQGTHLGPQGHKRLLREEQRR